jgi:hypothetical protein
MTKFNKKIIENYLKENTSDLPFQAELNWKIKEIPSNRLTKKNSHFCKSNKHKTNMFFAHNYHKIIC